MHLHTFTSIALLATSVVAKPIAHRPWFRRQFSNSSDSVITSSSTSIDRPTTTLETSPTCVATTTVTLDETCGDVASQYGIQLSAFEANSAADSDTCEYLLAGYRVCIAMSSLSATKTPISTTANETLTTSTLALSTSTLPTSTQSTITTSSTTTLTYTIGTGTSQAVRTITVVHTATEVIMFTRTIGYSSFVPVSTSIGNLNTTLTFPTSPNSLNLTSASTASSSTPSATSLSTSSSPSASSTVSETSSSACASTASPPAATQSGVVPGCTEWYVAVSGDYCNSVAERYNLNVDTFMAWNPAVDAPLCPNMLAGNAYCIAICGRSSSTASVLSSATLLTSSSSILTSTSSLLTTTVVSTISAAGPTATGSADDVYRMYTGDGSIAAGWPAQSQWVSFDAMFDANTANMKLSCANWGVPDDTDEEIADMKTAIQDIASTTGVDSRVILAVIMQESTGCVRVITTQYSVYNPGLMQSHNGTGSCNTNNAYLGIGSVGVVQTPCPESEIRQMIQDGTGGTASGDGFEQLLVQQGHTDVSRWYRAARMYNGGSIDPSGDLGKGCCTACYTSDVANRLTGWVNAPHGCTL